MLQRLMSPGETEGGDDGGPVHQGGDQQQAHYHHAVPLYRPDDQGVAAQAVQLRVPGLRPAHPGGGHLVMMTVIMIVMMIVMIMIMMSSPRSSCGGAWPGVPAPTACVASPSAP